MNGLVFLAPAFALTGLFFLTCGSWLKARLCRKMDMKRTGAEAAPGSQDRYREVLDALPVPVWTRGTDQTLTWANPTFLSILGYSTLEDAINANAALDWSEHDLTIKAL